MKSLLAKNVRMNLLLDFKTKLKGNKNMPPHNQSTTRLLTFLQCPMKYYFQYEHYPKIEILEGDMVPLYFGRVAHKIPEHFYSEINEPMAFANPQQHFSDICTILLKKYWDYRIPQNKLDQMTHIANLFATSQAELFTELKESGNLPAFYPISVEERITSEKYNVTCILDRLNGNKTMVDYKTTKKFPDLLLRNPKTLTDEEYKQYEEEYLPYLIQAIINAACVHDKYGYFPTAMLFVFLRHIDNNKHNGIIQVPITQKNVDIVFGIIKDANSKINARDFSKTTNLKNCTKYNGCEYKSHCDAANLCWVAI